LFWFSSIKYFIDPPVTVAPTFSVNHSRGSGKADASRFIVLVRLRANAGSSAIE
jgi:hypothetical protein